MRFHRGNARFCATTDKNDGSKVNVSLSRATIEAKSKVSTNETSVKRIINLRRIALRRGVWFKAINHVERCVIDLTVKYVGNIRSSKLAQVVTAILDKLWLAAESIVDKMVKSIGVAQARKISEIALSWGNRSASEWPCDIRFARYLAISHLNATRMAKI